MAISSIPPGSVHPGVAQTTSPVETSAVAKPVATPATAPPAPADRVDTQAVKGRVSTEAPASLPTGDTTVSGASALQLNALTEDMVGKLGEAGIPAPRAQEIAEKAAAHVKGSAAGKANESDIESAFHDTVASLLTAGETAAVLGAPNADAIALPDERQSKRLASRVSSLEARVAAGPTEIARAKAELAATTASTEPARERYIAQGKKALALAMRDHAYAQRELPKAQAALHGAQS